LYVILLVGIPFVLAILLSFSGARSGTLAFDWVGLRHFRTIISDPQFLLTLRNTLIFTVASQVLVMILATAAANVLEAAFFGKRAVRMLLLLPWAVPVSLATMAWAWIFDSTFSVINWTLRALGVFGGWIYWLGDPELAMIAIIIIHVWRMFPFATVVVLAGMTSIPLEIREAAVIDGASWSYQGSGSGGDYFRTDTIDDVEPEAFVVETQLTDMQYFVTWNFTPEALVNLCADGEFGTEIQLAFSNLPGAPTEGP